MTSRWSTFNKDVFRRGKIKINVMWSKAMSKITHALLILALSLFVWFTVDILAQTWWSKHIDFGVASKYGSFIGGFFSFITVLLIYFTLKHQSDSFNRTAFENKFFQLIGYHRSNIENWIYRTPDSKSGEREKGQRVFIKIHREILYAAEALHPFLSNIKIEDILNSEEIKKLNNNKVIEERKIDKLELQRFNIAYLMVLFGVGKEGRPVLERFLLRKYDKQFVTKILNYFQLIPAEWDNDETKIRENLHYKYFGGHQHRLGHYFRNLYQAVNYVNDYKPFQGKYEDKYNYVKTYRAQFSTYEQSVLFFNSLSDIGQKWELGTEVSQINKMLITKYNLIKNIPAEFILDLDLKKYYPDVEYEGEEKTKHKGELEEKYT